VCLRARARASASAVATCCYFSGAGARSKLKRISRARAHTQNFYFLKKAFFVYARVGIFKIIILFLLSARARTIKTAQKHHTHTDGVQSSAAQRPIAYRRANIAFECAFKATKRS
jgi:hypothetical protein